MFLFCRIRAQDDAQPPRSVERICLIQLTDTTIRPPTIPGDSAVTGFVYETDAIGARSNLRIIRSPLGMCTSVLLKLGEEPCCE